MEKKENDLFDQKLDLVNYAKFKPMDLAQIALNKRKSEKLEGKIRKKAGISMLYWDHTQNYSKERKIKTDQYIKDAVKKKNLEGLLKHYKKKPTFNSLLKKMVKEFTKKTMIEDKNRANLWLIFSGASSQMKKNKNYYYYLNMNCLKSKKHFDRIIKMDVKRTKAAVNDPKHAERLTNVLTNFAKRNSKIGYCQGFNFLVSFFLEKGFTEEEAFWIMVYVVEEAMPNEYYTNMLSVIADLKILQILFKIKHKSLYKHFQKIGIDLVMISLPCFITLFTNCENILTDIVIDNFFIQGPTVLIVSMILFFGYMKNDLLKINDLLGILKYFDTGLKKKVTEPKRFDQDLKKFFISDFIISELRKFYTEKERAILAKQKKNNSSHKIEECEKDWPICYYTLFKKSMYHRSPSFHLHRTKSILDNFNPNHFISGRPYDRSTVDVSEVEEKEFDDETKRLKFIENQLLMVRTRHHCKFLVPAADMLKEIKDERMKIVMGNPPMKRKTQKKKQPKTSRRIKKQSIKEQYRQNRRKNSSLSRKNSSFGGKNNSYLEYRRHKSSYSASPSRKPVQDSTSFKKKDDVQMTYPIKSLIKGLREDQTFGIQRMENKEERDRIQTSLDRRLSHFILEEMGGIDPSSGSNNQNHDDVLNTELNEKPQARVVKYDDLNANHFEILQDEEEDEGESIMKRISIANVNLDRFEGSASLNVRESLARFMKRVEHHNFNESAEFELNTSL